MIDNVIEIRINNCKDSGILGRDISYKVKYVISGFSVKVYMFIISRDI